MKQLGGIYLAIALFFALCVYFFGETRHNGFFYNVGQGLVWPVVLFSSVPEIDGDSPDEFNASYVEVLRSAQKHGLVSGVQVATQLWQFYVYAKSDPSVSRRHYAAILGREAGGSQVMAEAIAAINSSPELTEEYMDFLDGMTAADFVDEIEGLREDIEDLLEDRPSN